ncbi:MAG: hypothetical protein BGO98_23065 [Myxococcales bacterium 68-20]|nr:hypothetical protein [Myxococcales bacterium]OJY15315.1 MAG: hypothetical protein BGO98_23065 [Myxococcales bacterium 68-20]
MVSLHRIWPAVSGLVVFPSLGAVLLAAAACGDETALPEPLEDAGVDVAQPPPPPASSSDSGGGGTNEPPIIDVDCPVGTVVELEDNDSPAKANELDQGLSFCGAITPGSDVDYSTFTTPAGKKLALFQAVIDGAVDFDLVVNGKTLRPAEVSSFEAGKYVIKAYTKDAKPGKYRYRIQYEP